jgi:hypothetical protein
MKQTPQKTNDRHRVATTKTMVRRRKLTMIVLLFFIMTVLLIRVFAGKGGPAPAAAIFDGNAVRAAAESASQEVVYTELPVVAYRHNVLANDFFAAGDFKRFKRQGESTLDSQADTSVVSDRQHSSGLSAAVEKLELTAIVKDKKPQAFIEDKLFEKNQSFRFVFDGQIYDFKVINIFEDKVELECNGVIITKKIPESFSGMSDKGIEK